MNHANTYYIVPGEHLDAIGSAIRIKSNSPNDYYEVKDMAGAIESISASSELKAAKFDTSYSVLSDNGGVKVSTICTQEGKVTTKDDVGSITDTDVISSNIKSGVNIFGVTGNLKELPSFDEKEKNNAATVDHVLNPYYFIDKNGKIKQGGIITQTELVISNNDDENNIKVMPYKGYYTGGTVTATFSGDLLKHISPKAKLMDAQGKMEKAAFWAYFDEGTDEGTDKIIICTAPDYYGYIEGELPEFNETDKVAESIARYIKSGVELMGVAGTYGECTVKFWRYDLNNTKYSAKVYYLDFKTNQYKEINVTNDERLELKTVYGSAIKIVTTSNGDDKIVKLTVSGAGEDIQSHTCVRLDGVTYKHTIIQSIVPQTNTCSISLS